MRRFITQISITLGLTFTSALAVEGPAQPARGGAALDFRCLSDEHRECGCSLKIVNLACPASHASGWQAHFFSALNQGAPLWVSVAGRESSLRSNVPVTNSFRHGRGDRWREEYQDENLKVRIDYQPARSTCPAERGPDGCEYFDVAAEIVVTVAGMGSRSYRALGACGC